MNYFSSQIASFNRNYLRFVLISLVCVLSCTSEATKENIYPTFSRYIKDTFTERIDIDSSYFIIIGKQICNYCEQGTLEGFKIQQHKIDASKITLITDFKKGDIDTLLIEAFHPKQILFDTLGNFGNYSIPRSYITIYKVINGEIQHYAYLSDDTQLTSFLKQENLIIK
jgi:hypothetical protein